MAQSDVGIVLQNICPVPLKDTPPGEHRCETCHSRMRSVCSALKLDELSENENLSQPLCFSARSVLLREGEQRNAVFTITAGMVRLSRTLPNGLRQIVGFAMPGDFLGLDLTGEITFSAEAIGQVKACRFQRKSFIEFLHSKPHLMARMHELSALELRHAHDHMVVLGRKNADGKVAYFLLTVRDRLAQLAPSIFNVPLAMTRQDIADYLGLTIETVSRTISSFARRKLLVVTPDGVRLINIEKLTMMAEL